MSKPLDIKAIRARLARATSRLSDYPPSPGPSEHYDRAIADLRWILPRVPALLAALDEAQAENERLADFGEAVRAAFLHGARDDLWKPGQTVTQAVEDLIAENERLRAEVEQSFALQTLFANQAQAAQDELDTIAALLRGEPVEVEPGTVAGRVAEHVVEQRMQCGETARWKAWAENLEVQAEDESRCRVRAEQQRDARLAVVDGPLPSGDSVPLDAQAAGQCNEGRWYVFDVWDHLWTGDIEVQHVVRWAPLNWKEKP